MKEKIFILGGGESGTGAALLAKRKGYDVWLSDAGALQPQNRYELVRNQISFEENRHTPDKLKGASLLIKSPGISFEHPMVKKAQEQSIMVIDELEFAFRFLQGQVIAITGTNGKTTTALLTYHLLKSSGKNVVLAGNIGNSLARTILDNQYDWYVVEVSSFQLDGCVTFCPKIGVLLNITPDHLDRYEKSMEKYAASKFGLWRAMSAEDKLIGWIDDKYIQSKVNNEKLVPTWFNVSIKDNTAGIWAINKTMNFQFPQEHFSIEQRDTTLRGPHNLINTMCAVTAAYLSECSTDKIRAGLKNFVNAEHRLQPVGIIDGVTYVNDSKATNVDAVFYALESFDQPIIWIAGGTDKGNQYELIADLVKKKVKKLICLGRDNRKLRTYFEQWIEDIRETQNINEAVMMAHQAASFGDVVLLSPACASFDLFKNYEDRGNQFKMAVEVYAQATKK